MSASEGDGLMRPFSKKSGGAQCFIDKNCVRTLVKNYLCSVAPNTERQDAAAKPKGLASLNDPPFLGHFIFCEKIFFAL